MHQYRPLYLLLHLPIPSPLSVASPTKLHAPIPSPLSVVTAVAQMGMQAAQGGPSNSHSIHPQQSSDAAFQDFLNIMANSNDPNKAATPTPQQLQQQQQQMQMQAATGPPSGGFTAMLATPPTATTQQQQQQQPAQQTQQLAGVQVGA